LADIEKLGHPHLNYQYFYTDITSFAGYSIGVAGLNSAWRCHRKDGGAKLDVDLDTGHLLASSPWCKSKK